ncbi:MAG: M28 family peptidase, partial [Sphingobacteriales bacterium]
TIDIINLQTTGESAFAPHWHTQQDNMDIIDKNTLEAVGETLLQVIYEIASPAS